MLAKAKSKFIRISPYKLRPIADVVRGWQLDRALNWLQTCQVRRAQPLIKVVASAFANVKNKHEEVVAMSEVVIKEIKVDHGPTVTYFKAGAMGRTALQRKKMSHIEVVLGKKSA